ncbi:YdcF family protein [Kiloniella sp. b19]|uniref:YdcF family protein n=1 Tax=Kiloniella sp. GXU_MW_B19 TaxID=3141326 RepID=UPI0031D0D839
MRHVFRRERHSGLTGRLIWLALVALVLAWGLGFLSYADDLPAVIDDADSSSDAIVVLTGGTSRISTGLDLLSEGKADKLFISGVYKGVEVRELLESDQHTPERLECCIVLGYQADDTRGNAAETRQWARDNSITSIRLVTAAYHMPRSLLEFRHSMPDVTLIPHPVFPPHVKQQDWWLWPGSSWLILSEYNKYLLAQIRIWITDMLDPLFSSDQQ